MSIFDHAKICLKSLILLYNARKNFFKVCLVGTLNLCLKVPEKMPKNRDESDHSRVRKCQKTDKIRQSLNLTDFGQFLDVFFVGDDRIDFLTFASVQAS